MRLMTSGGNVELLNWFDMYEISDMPIEQKYMTVAAKYYRDRLKATVEDTVYHETAPDTTIGAVLIGQVEEPAELPEDTVVGKMSSLWGSFIRKTTEIHKEVSEKVKETETFKKLEEKYDTVVDDVKRRASLISDEIKVKTDSVVEEIKTKTDPVLEEVKRRTSIVMENETVIAVKNKTCEAAAIAMDFTEAQYNKINEDPRVQQAKQDAAAYIDKTANEARSKIRKLTGASTPPELQ